MGGGRVELFVSIRVIVPSAATWAEASTAVANCSAALPPSNTPFYHRQAQFASPILKSRKYEDFKSHGNYCPSPENDPTQDVYCVLLRVYDMYVLKVAPHGELVNIFQSSLIGYPRFVASDEADAWTGFVNVQLKIALTCSLSVASIGHLIEGESFKRGRVGQPIRVVQVSMDVAAPKWKGGGNKRSPRKPADSGIVWHDSHSRKSVSDSLLLRLRRRPGAGKVEEAVSPACCSVHIEATSKIADGALGFCPWGISSPESLSLSARSAPYTHRQIEHLTLLFVVRTVRLFTRFNPRPGHSRILASGNLPRRCRWSASFHKDLQFPPTLHSGTAPFSPHFTLIGSQLNLRLNFARFQGTSIAPSQMKLLFKRSQTLRTESVQAPAGELIPKTEIQGTPQLGFPRNDLQEKKRQGSRLARAARRSGIGFVGRLAFVLTVVQRRLAGSLLASPSLRLDPPETTVLSRFSQGDHGVEVFKLTRLPPRRVRFPAGSSPNFRMWQSCRTMPLVGVFSRGFPASPALTFRRCSVHTSFRPYRLSISRCLRVTQMFSLAQNCPLRDLKPGSRVTSPGFEPATSFEGD
ncbi:hypothetical protein PR048_030027 [Dryococelus australis]|uniref:Uncharacterized protein n=1 Tax=Dryococelus australis TaxID=614101 RepID=A0ABQ9GBP3_9NEOP|nr:hypothetical protein PR048_030027 [Dryococelus australis]